MKSDLIIIKEYCIQSRIEPDFIFQLENEGLIEISEIDNEQYINIAQLNALERYARWHYELSVNVEGIDVMQNMLTKIKELQSEVQHLKEYMKLLDITDI